MYVNYVTFYVKFCYGSLHTDTHTHKQKRDYVQTIIQILVRTNHVFELESHKSTDLEIYISIEVFDTILEAFSIEESQQIHSFIYLHLDET